MIAGAADPSVDPPRPGLAPTAAVAVLGAALAAIVLGAGPSWLIGPVGGGDAWQNLWNLDHVDRVLRGDASLWFSDRVWAPEGASLRAHTLAPLLSVPGAVVARVVGPVPAYNLLVLMTFALASGAMYRLARRLRIGPAGAVLAALVFAFAPARTARTFGHLNLLTLGLVPVAVEGLVVAARSSGRRAWAGAAAAAAALTGLVLTDWYLALLGAVAAAAFTGFEVARAAGRRKKVAVRLASSGLVALALAAPLARPLLAATGVRGHDPRLCCTALTSLVVPNRIQRVAVWTPEVTARNTQNVAEGAAYLGLVPLAALAWLVARPTRRPRDLDWAMVAGGVALVLALGPAPRLFDRWLDVVLPYLWLERALPALGAGGCVSRFVQLAALPLALAVGWTAERLRARGRAGRAVVVAGTLLLAVEYAPIRPPARAWPLEPPDPAVQVIAQSAENASVLDLDPGVGALVRQLRHGRAQTMGYLSRRPEGPWSLRRLDPVIGPLLGEGEIGSAPPLPVASAWLRHRWGVGWVTGDPSSDGVRRAAALGLETQAASDRSVVLALPVLPVPPLDSVQLGEPEGPLALRGVVLEGTFRPETVGVDGTTVSGRWTGPRALMMAPHAPGQWRLTVAAPRPDPPEVRLSIGSHTVQSMVRGVVELPITVTAAEVGPDGVLLVEVEASAFRPQGDPRTLGVFLVSLGRDPGAATPVESSRR